MKKRIVYMIIIASLTVFFAMLLTLCYWVYPAALSSSIQNNSNAKQLLLKASWMNPDRPTQPELFDSITVPLFETASEYPLTVACQKGDMEAIEKLLIAGADPNAQTNSSASCIEAVYISPRKPNRLELAQLLVEYGCDVTVHGGDYPAIILEARQAKIDQRASWENMQFLLENGAQTEDMMGNTILHYAVSQNCTYIAEQILSGNWANINSTNNNGQTALMNAVLSNNQESVLLLLQYNPDLTVKDNDGKTAYDYAVDNGLTNIAELLK